MPRPASSWGDEVASRARGMNLYVTRMDHLHAQRLISRVDIDRIYAGGFLTFYTFLERSLERLFIGLLVRRFISGDSAARPLISINSDLVAYAIVRGERSYVNWLPYKRYAMRRAKAFFSRGKPFTNLSNAEIKAFDRSTFIRNALAHESSSALRVFRENFTEGKALPPGQLRPAGYLRGQHAVGQTRFNLILSDIVRTVRILCV